MHAMDVVPYHFFVWCQHSLIGAWISQATWVFPILETIHIMAFSTLIGTMVLADLRLLGSGMRRTAIQQLAGELEPWTLAALLVTIITGALLFSSEAIRLSLSGPFFDKMIFFIIALAIHFTIHWKAVFKGVERHVWIGKLVGALSLCSWFLVALAGRGIAFLP